MDATIAVSMPILSLLVLLPMVGAIVLMFFPEEEKGLIRNTTTAFMLLGFVMSLVLLGFDGGFESKTATPVSAAFPTMQFVEQYPWIDALGATYLVGVDGFSLWLVLLTTFLGPLVVLSTYTAVTDRVKEFMIALLVLQTGMLGALVALDGLLFYIFWELMLIPMYFLIGIWGGSERHYAAMKLFLYTIAGSLLMLVGLMYLYFGTGAVDGTYSFALSDLMAVELSVTEQTWLFAAFAVAFAIKVPLFPFHTWLPDAHVQAPTAGSVILAGVLLKMGTYGLVRYAMPLFPEAMTTFAPWVAVLSVIGIIYGALIAIVQKDVKKLVAYSSVSHLGFCVLGLVALTPQSVEGAMYVMLAHGIATGGLFLCVGVIYERLHTREIAKLGGLTKVVPKFATLFMIIIFTSVGVPGLAGFVGEFLVLLGTSRSQVLHFGTPELWFETATKGPLALEGNALVLAALGTTGVIFGAVYLLWMFQRVMFGPLKNPENAHMKDVNFREVCVLVPLVLMGLVMGLFPEAFLGKVHKTTDHFINVQMQRGIQAKLTDAQRVAMTRAQTADFSSVRRPGASGAAATGGAKKAAPPALNSRKTTPSAGNRAQPLPKGVIKGLPSKNGKSLKMTPDAARKLRERLQRAKQKKGAAGAPKTP